MKPKINAVFCTALLVVTLTATPTFALTAGEVLELKTEHRTGFFIGATDMASHLFAVDGQEGKAQCVLDWFFSSDREEALPEIQSFFEAHKDRDAVAVLHVLINRKCGQ